MNKRNNIKYRELDSGDIQSTLLLKFNRYQETNRVLWKENNKYLYKNNHFIDQWNDEKKALVIQSLKNCISGRGSVIGAFLVSDLIAFGCIEGELFGIYKDYLELSYIHVSNEYRNLGIGKKIYRMCCEKAKQKDATKLYIGAHPSEETQNFYRAIGCTLAKEINKKIYDKEPLDIQLEFVL